MVEVRIARYEFEITETFRPWQSGALTPKPAVALHGEVRATSLLWNCLRSSGALLLVVTWRDTFACTFRIQPRDVLQQVMRQHPEKAVSAPIRGVGGWGKPALHATVSPAASSREVLIPAIKKKKKDVLILLEKAKLQRQRGKDRELFYLLVNSSE